jgi:hypothetical protein
MDAEIRLNMQAAQIMAYKKKELEVACQRQLKQMEQERQGHLETMRVLQAAYRDLTKTICARVGVDPQLAVIDVETRVIREEKNG